MEYGYDNDYLDPYEDEYALPHEEYERNLGNVLEYLHEREQQDQARAAEAEWERRRAAIEKLAERYPLRDEKFAAEIDRRTSALAQRAGRPDLTTDPEVVEEIAKAVQGENTPHPDDEKFARIAAHDTSAFGESTDDGAKGAYERRRKEALAHQKAQRKAGAFDEKPTAPSPNESEREAWVSREVKRRGGDPSDADERHWARVTGTSGDPFTSPRPPDLGKQLGELTEEIRGLRSDGEPAPSEAPES